MSTACARCGCVDRYANGNCKTCARAYDKNYSASHPSNDRVARWRKANKEKVRLLQQVECIRDVTNLTDIYVRRCLCQRTTLKHSDIPQELVEVKRLQLLIERKCREERNRTS